MPALKLITQNPFRILGVYANARPADIVSNCDDMEVCLSVNQSVSFDLDFNNLMPTVTRTQETVAQAKSKINLPKDKLKYALFWFVKDSSSAHAMNYLKNGDFDNADNVFEIEDAFSTRINKAVVAMMQNDLGTAIANITEMIHDNDDLGLRDAFVKAICGDAFSISEEELAHLFIDKLLEEINASDLMDLFQEFGVSENDDDYLREKAIAEPISNIYAEIAKAKAVKRDDANANLRAGKALMNNTKPDLAKVKDLLGATDMKYQMLADDLAETIMQCGIYYYNNTDDDDSVENTLTIQKYACKIAVGKMCKDRCKENLRILERKKEELPPKEVRYYDKKIKEALATYMTQPNKISYAIDLIKKVMPYLMSIKEMLGGNDTYYLRISTKIVNMSLHNVIEEFNDIMNDDDIQLQIILGKVTSVFEQAWKATLYMDKLDMEPEFRSGRYNKNRSVLRDQVKQLINVYQTVSLDMRGETEIFEGCRTITDFNNYSKLFPDGKYASQVKGKIEKLEFDACETTQDCQAFSDKYPRSIYDINAKWEECYYNQCNSISLYEGYLRYYPNGKYVSQAKAKIDKLSYESCQTISDYKAYMSKFPDGKYFSQAKNIVDDEEMWRRCTYSNNKDLYKKYLVKFPNGRHKTEAEQKVRSCYIATMCYGNYDHPQVLVLRDFRDSVLLHHSWGQEFVRFYYRNSPNWVEHLKDKQLINKAIRAILDKFIILYKYVKK